MQVTHPGTAVTMTSAPTLLRKMFRTFDQYCILRLGNAAGPRTSKPYRPENENSQHGDLDYRPNHFPTMTKHDRVARCSQRIIEGWVLH